MPEKSLISKLKNEIEVMERHLHIMKIVTQNSPIGIIKLSELTGYPPHKVRYSLRILENHNFIIPSSNGAIMTDKAESFMNDFKDTLRHIIKKLEFLEETIKKPL